MRDALIGDDHLVWEGGEQLCRHDVVPSTTGGLRVSWRDCQHEVHGVMAGRVNSLKTNLEAAKVELSEGVTYVQEAMWPRRDKQILAGT